MVSFHRFRPLLPFIIGVLGFGVQACAEWNEKVLYSFQGIPDGATPVGGVVFDSAGNLYGATTDGGADNCPGIAQCGTVFELKPPAQKGGTWTETVLYVFKGKTANDGSTPAGGVILDKQGNIYGTTGYGGSGDCVLLGTKTGCGTVWELNPPNEKDGKWTETILYSFQSAKDGWLPQGALTFDSAGNLYGATEFGGNKGTTCNSLFGGQCGTVFELSPPSRSSRKWIEKVLHNFAGGTKGERSSDGAEPNGGLVLDGTGNIFGTTYYGGDNAGKCDGGVGGIGCGAVFKLVPPAVEGGAWIEKILFRLDGHDGVDPASGVFLDKRGIAYFTTIAGGGGGFPSGVVAQLAPGVEGMWKILLLHSFQDNGDGGVPMAPVVSDAKGDIFGTASEGGGAGGGTLFELTPESNHWNFRTLYSFTGKPDGSYPSGPLAIDRDGNMLGTTQRSGTGQTCGSYGCGTVFKLSH
jgi:hypothetical protein